MRPTGDRWIVLWVMTRVAAIAMAVALLIAHRVTAFDAALGWFVVTYGGLSILAVMRAPRLVRRPGAWLLDCVVGLVLIWISGDWRSPFYLFALTALAPPVAMLPYRQAVASGAAFTLAFIGVALLTGLDPWTLKSTVSLETLATHLALPGVVTFGLAYAADVMRRLEAEQERAQELAVEAERRRIAWELHDSAKQRLHAAHLVLSSLEPSDVLELALEQLRGATADMETSIAELRSPLEGRPLSAALRDRAAELAALEGGVSVAVEGEAPRLPTVAASHAYRILAEAMTNAVRHAGAREVRVTLATAADGGLHAIVADDGRGLPSHIRPGANGIRTMRSRAFAIGGRLTIGSGSDPGTRVRLDVPSPTREGVPA
ncbi:MAG TPA: sensor histidine kinase [Solirubrobacteraceae bacterium]